MNDQKPHVVIVGAGLAGSACAQTLRARGFSGSITLVGREAYLPYDRPCLSKELLAGTMASPPSLLPDDWAREADVEFLLNDAVQTIEQAPLRVSLTSGRTLTASHIVLATGASARELSVDGMDLQGVHRLRTWDDARALRTALITPGCRLAIIGGGLIGCEVASTARAMGCEVTILESSDELLTRAIGSELGRLCHDSLTRLGVCVRLGTKVESLLGAERVEAVQCADGSHIAVDAVLLSIGAAPETALARAAGLVCEQGVVVDACGRTSVPGVYAVGDVAQWPIARGGSRCLETYINSQQQGAVVAQSILGIEAPAPQIAKGWTKIAGMHLQMAGDVNAGTRTIWREIPGKGAQIMFRLDGSLVVGVVVVDGAREFSLATSLISLGELDESVIALLSDVSVPMKTVVDKAKKLVLQVVA